MNVPAMAKKSFDELKDQHEFIVIVHRTLKRLKKISNALERARFIHQTVDEFNKEVFSHPLVKKLSPCKQGCTACCHTQVSVTEDEAALLAQRVREGVKINLDRLRKQMSAKNSSLDFFKLNYEERKCVFLDDQGSCSVYSDRPSICRTNSVIGTAEQCDTKKEQKTLRLVRTPKSDMAIYAFYYFSSVAGALPYLLGKKILDKEVTEQAI